MSLSQSRQENEAPIKTRNELKIRMRRRTRKKRRRLAADAMQIVVLTFLLVVPFFVSATAAKQQREEETETTSASPKISTTTTAAAAANATRAHPKQQPKQQRQRIYRIRAAQLNGNLTPPIRVLSPASPVQQQAQLSTFGARSAPAATAPSTRANLQLAQQQNDCAKTNTDGEQQEASSSISATSQVLRFLNGASASSSNRSSSGVAMQRLGEIEETSAARPSTILLGNKSREAGEQTTTTANSILNLIDEYDSKITTNKTRAQLSCDSGEMILRLNFSEPFKGIVYPDNNRLSPCRFFGDGHHNYELRLPLRGCGTKQVAQRVFVNDVIVRFHKSLELEEDEVKTLICRYPPPLTSQQFASSEDPTQMNQFELIEPTARQNHRHELGGGGSSDNLLAATAAPPGGHSPNHLNNGLPYGGTVQELAAYGGDRPATISNGAGRNPLRPSADLIDQRSSDLQLLNGQQQPTRTIGGLAGYFERLSSIELLFLISSLMFLVLLALGLAGGYFCFRRQAASQRQASAILRRKRRFLGGAGMLAPPHASAAGLLHHGHAGPPSDPRHHHMHLYYPQHPHHAHHQHNLRHHNHLQQQHAAPSTSSPESDLSGRGLLTTSQRPAAAEHEHYMFNNRAFVPDAQMQGRNVAPAPPVPPPTLPKPVIGRRADPLGIYGRHQQPTGGRSRVTRATQPGHQARIYSMTDVSDPGRHYQARAAAAAGLHRAQQVFVDQPVGGPRELSRAKSLTHVARDAATGSRSRRSDLGAPLGGTLAGYQRRGHHSKRQRQQHYLPPLTSTKSKTRLEAISDARKRQHDWLQVSSDSELETNNNNSNATAADVDKGTRSKIFLKSIEDSYITKFTEVEEKEYMKRDSMRPLGLTEWREKIAEQHRDGSSYKSSSSSGSENDLPPEPPVLRTTRMDPSEPEPEYRSTNANLRSLTELDVNFAKSLLRPSQEPNKDDDQDLIVSPEYDLNARLKLTDEDAPTTPGAVASSSRNSVSYV